MKALSRVSMVALLALAVLAGAGCGSKSSQTSPATVDSGSSEPAPGSLAAQISSGIVYFDYNMYAIKPEYRDMLRKKADLIKSNPKIRVRIEGNCDERGTQEYNLALGERRARAAHDYLARLGVKASQMEIISYGKERPAVKGDDEAAWAKNRRDEFRVVAGQ